MVFTSFVSLVSLRKNPCATRQNPHNSREIHPNGDLLIHHFVVPLLRWRRLFDKSKFEACYVKKRAFRPLLLCFILFSAYDSDVDGFDACDLIDRCVDLR